MMIVDCHAWWAAIAPSCEEAVAELDHGQLLCVLRAESCPDFAVARSECAVTATDGESIRAELTLAPLAPQE